MNSAIDLAYSLKPKASSRAHRSECRIAAGGRSCAAVGGGGGGGGGVGGGAGGGDCGGGGADCEAGSGAGARLLRASCVIASRWAGLRNDHSFLLRSFSSSSGERSRGTPAALSAVSAYSAMVDCPSDSP